MNRLAYRFYRWVSGARHWAIRRFTPGGWILVVGLMLSAGMATDTEQSVGYQVFSVLLCLTVVAVVLAPFFRARFQAERRLPRFASVGQPLRYTIVIRNLTARRLGGLQVLDGLTDPRPGFDEFTAAQRVTKRHRSLRLGTPPDFRRVLSLKPQELPFLPSRKEAVVEMELIPIKRGVIHFNRITVARPDPFRLFRAFSHVHLPGTMVILPRRYPLPPLPLPGTQQYQHGGVALAAAIGESEEFVSLREYRPGDPMRHIHWRSWARVGRPIVKEFQDEFFVRHALILDTFAQGQGPEVFEEAVSVAASFACTIETRESLLDLLFVGPQAFSFTMGRGVGHVDQALEILASVQPCAEGSFDRLEQLVLEHAEMVSGCICIFVDWDDARRRLVQRLRSVGVQVLVLVIRAAGAKPLPRQPEDPETLHVLEVGDIEAGLTQL